MSNFRIGVDSQDVFLGKEKGGRKPTEADLQTGDAVLIKKYNAGSNKKGGVDAKRIEEKVDDTDTPLVHKTVNRSVAQRIQQARSAKGMSQKDLAQRINEKQQLVSDYESGRAIPNQQTLIMMEKVLGVKLRGVN